MYYKVVKQNSSHIHNYIKNRKKQHEYNEEDYRKWIKQFKISSAEIFG